MALKKNVIYIYFKGKHLVTSKSQYQYNHGQFLYFADLDLPQTFEVHFSNTDEGYAKPQIGSNRLVEIPDAYFWTKSSQIYAWIYLHEGTTDGETKYEVIINLERRSEPVYEEILPTQQTTIERAIAELNNAVDVTTENANKTGEDRTQVSNIKDEIVDLKEDIDANAELATEKAQEAVNASLRSEASAQNAVEYESNAHGYSNEAKDYAQQALESKITASQKATIATDASVETLGYRDETLVAKNDVLNLKQDVIGYKNETKGYLDETKGVRADVQNIDNEVKDYASQAQASATNASQSATASANSASASAQSASQSAQIKADVEDLADDAQGYAQASAQSATTSANSASQAQGYAQSASSSAQSASQYASQAQGYANTASAKAQDASGYAQTASTKASESAQSATNASQSAQTAEQAKTDAQTAQGLAESARDSAISAKTDAESAKADAESARDEAQTIVDGISAKTTQIDSNTENIASLTKDKAPVITDTASGSIASFSDGADDLPLKSLIVDINPIQDLSNGDPSPENICPISGWTQTILTHAGSNLWNPVPNGKEKWAPNVGEQIPSITTDYSSFADNVLTVNNTWAWQGNAFITNRLITGKTYKVTGIVQSDSNRPRIGIYVLDAYMNVVRVVGYVTDNGNLNVSVTMGSSDVCICVSVSNATDREPVTITNPCISETGVYEPYTGTSITIDLGQTVYGGKLDVLSGELTVDMAMVDLSQSGFSYNNGWHCWVSNSIVNAKIVSANTTAVSAICSTAKAVKASGYTSSHNTGTLCQNTSGTWMIDNGSTTELTGQLVYELAEPIEIQLTPNQLNSLYGVNNIWADTGDVEVEHRADTKLYIDKKIAEAIASITQNGTNNVTG